jgi:small subunit ribosomal protein S18
MNSKQCFFKQHNIQHIDYKDTEILKKFLNPHGRILGKYKTSVSAKSQRKLALAVKRARFMGLLPYLSR